MRGVRIGSNVWISQLVYIDELHPEAVTIGDNCTIGLRTSIFTHFYWGPRRENSYGEVVIGNDVFIGSDSQLVAPVKVGDGAYVASGSTVTRDVPPDDLAISRVAQVNRPGTAKRLRKKLRDAKEKLVRANKEKAEKAK